MGFTWLRCWRCADGEPADIGSANNPVASNTLEHCSSEHTDSSPVVSVSNRDWDWTPQHMSNNPLSLASALRASPSVTAPASPKRSGRSDTGRSSSASKAASNGHAGLPTFSRQCLPADTRTQAFVVLRVDAKEHIATPIGSPQVTAAQCTSQDSRLAAFYGAAAVGTAATSIGNKALPPGAAPPSLGAVEQVLSPAFVSRRAMAGFSILQTHDFAGVLCAQLFRDPLLTFALQRALRHLGAREPRSVKHAFADVDAGGPLLDSGPLHTLCITSCIWASGSSSTTAAGDGCSALLLIYYLPYDATAWPSSPTSEKPFEQVIPQMRDARILRCVPNMITMVDMSGRVHYQNEASHIYMGDWSSAHCAETLAAAEVSPPSEQSTDAWHRQDDSAEVKEGSAESSGVGDAEYGPAKVHTAGAGCGSGVVQPPRNVLALLLAHDPGCAEEIVEAALAGRRWSRTVRVPASLKNTLRDGVPPQGWSQTSTARGGLITPIPPVRASSPRSHLSHLPLLRSDSGDVVFAGFRVRNTSSRSGAAATGGCSSPAPSTPSSAAQVPCNPLGSFSSAPAGPAGPSARSMGPAILAAPRNDSASFLLPAGRMDSRTDSTSTTAPPRRIIALLGGADRGGGPQSVAAALNAWRMEDRERPGGSLPKMEDGHSLPPTLPASRSEPLVAPVPMAAEMATPAAAEPVPLVAMAVPAQMAVSALVAHVAPSEVPCAATGLPPSLGATAKRIHFWDGTDGQSAPPEQSPLAMQQSKGAVASVGSSPPASIPARPCPLEPSPSRTRCSAAAATQGLGGQSQPAQNVPVGSATNSPAQGTRTSEGGQNDSCCWHELHAIPLTDPLLDKLTDVTRMVLTEERLGDLTDAQLTMLEQLFPRHVMEYMLSNAPSALSRNLGQLASYHPQVTITFFDIVGFTSMSQEADARQVLAFLNELYTRFDELIDLHHLYKIDVVGDCYIVCAGLITRDADGFERVQQDGEVTPEEAARQARSIMAFCKCILQQCSKVRMPNGELTSLRIGIHCGSVVSGLVGPKMPKFTCLGDSMNFASRMESTGKPGCIQASAACAGLLPEEKWVLTSGVQVKGIGTVDTFMWTPEPEDLQARSMTDSFAHRSLRKRSSCRNSLTFNERGLVHPSLAADGENSESGRPNNTRRMGISDYQSRNSTAAAAGVLTTEASRTLYSSQLSSMTRASSSGSGHSGCIYTSSGMHGTQLRSRPPSAHGNKGHAGSMGMTAGAGRPQSGRGLRAQISGSAVDPMSCSLLTILAHIREAQPVPEDSGEEL